MQRIAGNPLLRYTHPMAWLIGIDEAGYGPNLGPLVVAASAWWVEDESRVASCESRANKSPRSSIALAGRRGLACDLYTHLADIVSPTPSTTQIAIADSKQLYKPGAGLRQLERGVLVGLRNGLGDEPARWKTLIGTHAPKVPWYADYNCKLPLDAGREEITDLSSRFTTACVFAGVHLHDLRTRMVFPREFNELTTHFGTKGAALSHVSIGLVRDVLESLPSSHPPAPSPLFITCDKHGGRNRYLALLQHYFPDQWIDTLAESGPVSHYAWGASDSRTEIKFRTNGEAELPVALASMTAKYHRELAMRAFNDYWCRQIPGLKPTAGYPMDAKRFKAAIAGRQRELAIEEADIWREK
ncbi:hypothetical protein [Bythopirellula goksoeyrii]|uniref:Uncharacterized protein n=1 Tax=Bythopirellula goksoeyrii TaxID=1400387 RepID=A0A5B9QJR2_9BACT|nr:hypothetical protein [Bythopirellula goksoeyrii]QEG37775.1 Hypothetical protein Pr1d_51220 [Bythopirellula goksoeyrii]